MTVHIAEPLPECSQCGRPIRRSVAANTGGLCTADAAWSQTVAEVGIDQAAAVMDDLREWQDTVARIRRAEVVEAVQRRQRRQRRRAER